MWTYSGTPGPPDAMQDTEPLGIAGMLNEADAVVLAEAVMLTGPAELVAAGVDTAQLI